MSRLTLWIKGEQVGVLEEQNNIWALRYTPEWLASPDGFDLSPALPRGRGEIVDGGSDRPVQWFFDNLLPEEGARTLMAQDAAVDTANAFGLLSWYGAESAGALTLLVPGQTSVEGELVLLRDEVLSRRIRQLPRVSLSAESPKRMSLAGAQHKLAVVLQGEQLYEPQGARASTHILKPDHPDLDSYPHSVANEWFVMSLAARLKLPVPPVQIRRVPEPVYLIERFDRALRDDTLIRRHVLDGCQLLSLDRTYKYHQATFENLATIIDLCRNKAQTRQALFRWLVFNTLIGNNDAHLKNLSFFARPDGITLAPHYDLLSTRVYARDHGWMDMELSWPLGSARSFSELSREMLLGMGEVIGVPASVGAGLLDYQLKYIDRLADELIESSTRVLTAGELRLLRQVRHGVLRDIAAKLAAPA